MADPAAAATTPGEAIEAALPEPQRWLNRFCENWIFAFLVAMAIRHFVLEAFRIPTGSMEPMLYGDPGFLKGDHVVVDKLSIHFRSPHRWDVTVFQFPEPEVEYGDNARPAVTADGERLDQWPLRPLMYRNFVKRLVALPGDTFYIANGDIYLKQPDGSFQVARKPPAIQEAVYQEIYRAGEQDGYLPWSAAGASTVASSGEGLSFHVQGQDIVFTQPFWNLYLKPGLVRVKPFLRGAEQQVEVAMTHPVFTYDDDGGRSIPGNIWDMDQWQIYRLSSSDIDNGSDGTLLNSWQHEFVGDIRLQGTVSGLTGHPALEIRHGTQQGERLVLASDGWRLEGMGGLPALLAHGPDHLDGHRISLAHLDNQVIVASDGVDLARLDVPPVDPQLQRLQVAITGSGDLAFSAFHIQRDLHYTANYVLIDQAREKQTDEKNANNSDLDEVSRDRARSQLADITRVRTQFGAPPGSTAPWACSPATAATVPPGCYLLLGDNSPTSWDGRAWGFVPAENLRGRALAVVLPPTRWRLVR